ncbi:MAG TPA: carboxymuconolactone decarboxylase family protein [Chloroflexota bacterium]
MARLPAIDPGQLSTDDKAILDKIVAVRPGAATGGPFAILMHRPKLADRAAALEDYFRESGSTLSGADRELIVLATVRETGARYPWVRHEIRAAEEGVRPEALEIVRAQGSTEKLTERERAFVDLARELVRTHGLSDEQFNRALKTLGEDTLIEAVALAGHYTLVSFIANGFAIAPPDGARSF